MKPLPERSKADLVLLAQNAGVVPPEVEVDDDGAPVEPVTKAALERFVEDDRRAAAAAVAEAMDDTALRALVAEVIDDPAHPARDHRADWEAVALDAMTEAEREEAARAVADREVAEYEESREAAAEGGRDAGSDDES